MKTSPPNLDEANKPSAKEGSPEDASLTQGDVLPGDVYQEGPYLVFTAQYHLRRGFCCNSGCRHCPYK